MFFLSLLKEIFNKFIEKKKKPRNISLSGDIPHALKKSLKFRVVDVGDDEGTMAELYALEGPAYSLEQYGIGFTASPKHADGVIVVGAVTKNMAGALIDCRSKVPPPKILIALGDKAIYGDSRFIETHSVEKIVQKPDFEIPGNPPTAQDIMSYLVSIIKK